MKFLKYTALFVLLTGSAYSLYFYITVYSKLTPADIDPDIKNEKIFKIMDFQKELINGTEKYDSVARKKSSSVLFYAGKKPTTKDELFIAGFNNCRAISLKGKINISIGYNSGYSGGGYKIDYLYGRYEIQPYSFTDVVPDNRKESDYKILRQNLTLDKRYYRVGDSLYGKIDFAMQFNNAGEKPTVYGNGYFRTRVDAY
ncbi:hypothetical protein [Chryseobacterium camelliae]|uniref:hypothetical protein n=1 Tax=Chryseobacterium camelliae TaxID=1265445 RepID=UPI000C1CA82B|nr:hypothetical protein [Chryseobacterium camelliae]MDR6516727.1 hypothetical protein [Chryseobacterium camelliae]